jgi:hypothetical protein
MSCTTRTSTRATFPRRASSVILSVVFWPMKRGAGVSDWTPGTDWRHAR